MEIKLGVEEVKDREGGEKFKVLQYSLRGYAERNVGNRCEG